MRNLTANSTTYLVFLLPDFNYFSIFVSQGNKLIEPYANLFKIKELKMYCNENEEFDSQLPYIPCFSSPLFQLLTSVDHWYQN